MYHSSFVQLTFFHHSDSLLIPRIYFMVLILFLVPVCYIITVQILKLITRESLLRSYLPIQDFKSLTHDKILTLAGVYISKKMWLSCIVLLESVLVKDSERKEEYYNGIGFCYYSVRKYEMAKVYYNKAIAFAPDYILALSNLAKVYRVTGDKDNALKAYQRILCNDPESKVAQVNIASLTKVS